MLRVSLLRGSITAAAAGNVSARQALSCVAVRSYSDHSLASWSPSQVRRQDKMKGPRFTDVDLSKQPLPKPAIDMIAKQPVIKTHSRIAVCDGGHAGLGHPRVYINLDDPKAPNDCGYCGQKFVQEHDH